ncbi:MAG: NUDIX hydrolase, partial [Candidatus Latescibacterota bacterium]
MPTQTACAVIRDGDGRVLMTQREDYEVWCLPGGHVE